MRWLSVQRRLSNSAVLKGFSDMNPTRGIRSNNMKTKRERLAEKIAAKVKAEFDVELIDFQLIPARGAWRTSRALDVNPWHGWATWSGQGFSTNVSIDSWNTMTELLRKGFTVTRESPCRFELDA